MNLRSTTFGILLLGAILCPARADDDQKAEDEKLLEDAKQSATGDGLCAFFRKQTPSEASLKRVPGLIGQLGSDDFETRQKASEALLDLGSPILPLLRKEVDHPDIETRQRVRGLIEKLENATAGWTAASARLLRDRKPKEGIEALLAYLPYAINEEVENEVVLTLFLLGTKDGKVDDRLARAIDDTAASRRSAAALVLARSGDRDQKKLAEKALKDPEPLVRFRVALGFIAAGEKAPVPVLLGLLTDAPLSLAEKAEDLLVRVAGESNPSECLGTDEASRKKCRTAWEEWWKQKGDAVDLTKRKIEVAETSPAQLARETVRKFVSAVNKLDAPVLEKILDENINIYGFNVVARKDLMKQLKDAPRTKENSISVGTIKSAKLADAVSPDSAKFVEAFAKENVQAVSIEATNGGRQEKLVLVLRVKGGKAVIAGIAQGK